MQENMENSIETFFNSATYRQMHPQKKAAIKELLNNIKGKRPEECVPFLMKANMTLKRQNLSFSKEESTQIFLLLTTDMTPDKRAQLNRILKIM